MNPNFLKINIFSPEILRYRAFFKKDKWHQNCWYHWHKMW